MMTSVCQSKFFKLPSILHIHVIPSFLVSALSGQAPRNADPFADAAEREPRGAACPPPPSTVPASVRRGGPARGGRARERLKTY